MVALANSANSNTKTSRKIEDSEKGVSKSKQRTAKQDRSVLIDITNDSPIVGLASGNLNETPLSSFSKQRRSNCCKKTPGSGEALLRGQVKNLLQKVEEEAEISKFCLESCGETLRLGAGFKALFNSPAGLVAPTPLNTPLVLNFSAVEDFESLSTVSEPPIQDQLILPQVVNGIIDEKNQAESESEEDLMISRALFLDFTEKSDSSSECSSVVTYQGTIGVEETDTLEKVAVDDDDASIWSIQVNASTRGDDEDEDEDEVVQDSVDELCEGISSLSVDGETKGPKHTRFVYNSDDELVEEYEEFDSTEFLRLKGLPTPKGKHVRFQDEDGDEDEE